nr:MAG: RNA-dependent RNA polymerase [Porcine picobirnavirus]
MSKSNASKRYFESSFELPNQGLRAYFDRVVKGQSNVYETPFAKGESTQQLLGAWMDVLKSIGQKWPSLWDYENDLAKKVGPMSIMLPLKDRMDDIDSYYEGILLPSAPLDHSAVAAVVAEWSRIRGLEVRRQSETINLMKKSTNSGSPYFRKRRLVTDQTKYCNVYQYQGDVVQVLGLPKFHYFHEPWESYSFYDTACAILGWRGQEGGPAEADVKQRVVWMFPYAVNICELMVYQPVIEAAQKFKLVPAWVSMEEVDRRITAMFDTKADGDLVVCTDFSKFDQHFNAKLQDAAREILAKILSPANSSTKSSWWLRNVFPIKYMIPLAYNWDQVRFGQHGMASGSGGTNCDETLAHRALQYEAAQRAGAYLNPNSQCLGDDGILTYPGITVEDVVKTYSSHGLEMNPDKQYASTQDCVYLRRWHHKDYREDGVCVGVYSTCRALGRLRYLERYMNPEYWDSKAVALRQLSIIENVKYHPMKEEFVEFCMKRDKYRLGIDIPGFLDNIRGVAQEYIENMPDFLGYTKTLQSGGDELGGIENWWIVKYLKSK